MDKKVCIICGALKSLGQFYRQATCKDDRVNQCKNCMAEIELARRQTKTGLIKRIYEQQIAHSKNRGFSSPDYSLDELTEALMGLDIFHTLYDNWKASGYETALKPSVDRDSNLIGFTRTNLSIMTWQENNNKNHFDEKNNIDPRKNIPVSQYNLEGDFIRTYHSMKEAERQTNIASGTISRACSGNGNTAGNHKWKYSTNNNFNKVGLV